MEQLTLAHLFALTGALIAPFAAFVAVVFLTGGTAVGSADVAASVSRARAAPTPVAAKQGRITPAITVRHSSYGQILFDGTGHALYAFTRDPRGRSVCAKACSESWPPYLVRGSLSAGAGAKASLLGVTRRPDGARQLTYAGHPLYYWVGDREPGDVGCQNVSEFGGVWLVLRANGRLVT